MNVIVMAAASREGGALMIYRQFLSHLPEHIGEDRYYVFIEPEMPAPEIPGVTYFPVNLWKSMRSRIRFDAVGCRRFLEEKGVRADKLISFQNTGVNALKDIPQLVYYHQAIPFYPYHWSPFKASERGLIIYKRFYPWFVRTSIGKHTHIVVQTEYVKLCFARFFHFEEQRIHVLFPDVKTIDRTQVQLYPYEAGYSHFIYPAFGVPYKNHRLLFRALQLIRAQKPGIFSAVRIHLSVTEKDAPELAATIREADLGTVVQMEGGVPYEVLLQKYAACKALLFPSKMETIGLPLLEAASLGLPVLAADLGYAHDVLKDYAGVQFLPLEEPARWAESITSLAEQSVMRYPYDQFHGSSWPEFFRIVSDM